MDFRLRVLVFLCGSFPLLLTSSIMACSALSGLEPFVLRPCRGPHCANTSSTPPLPLKIHEVNFVLPVDITNEIGPAYNEYWKYSSFKANRSISVVSVGIVGPASWALYRVHMKITDQPDPSTVLVTGKFPPALGDGSTKTTAYVHGGVDNKVFYVAFKEPVPLDANKMYEVSVCLSGGPDEVYQAIGRGGEVGQSSQDVDCDSDHGVVHFDLVPINGQIISMGFRILE